MSAFVFFCLGFFVLVGGARVLLRGAVSLSRILRVPGWVIGAIIVGVGTSLPEFSITIASALGGSAVGLGTIIGSNTFNLLAILGLGALATPISLPRPYFSRYFLANAAAVVVVLIFAATLGGGSFAGIGRGEALVLLVLFALWVRANLREHDVRKDDTTPERATLIVSALLVCAGLVGVVVGGKFVVDGAAEIARLAGVGEALIALLIVGPGTSLPELWVTLAALRRRETGLALGNIAGSNLFDVLGIIGAAALIRPLPFPSALFPDMWVTLGAVLLVLAVGWVAKNNTFSRRHGVLFLAAYALYVAFLLWRG